MDTTRHILRDLASGLFIQKERVDRSKDETDDMAKRARCLSRGYTVGLAVRDLAGDME